MFTTGCLSKGGKPNSMQLLGLSGDGKKDDTAALQKAVDTQLEIDLGKGIYRITSKITIKKNNVSIIGNNAQILFDGSYAERLLWIEANNIKFRGVVFNGNNKQVKGSLVYLARDSKNISFNNCQFKNIKGIHQGAQSNYSNAQYAVMISPKEVNCSFENCQFKNISNDNSGKYLPAYTGGGFVGAIFFCNSNFKDDTNTSSGGTHCSINLCTFDNIQTILAKKITKVQQLSWNDADAIRTYTTKSQRLNLTVTNSKFSDISKRAVKFSGTVGGLVKACSVTVDKLQYPMTTAFKLSQGNTIENISIQGLPDKPIDTAFQMHNAKDIILKNIDIYHCSMLLNSAPTIKSIVISNIILDDIKCSNCQGGIINSTYAEKVKEVRVTNIEILNTSNKAFKGFENFIASKFDNENYFQNITIDNGYMKLGGYNNTIKNIVINITADANEAIFARKRCIFEAFGAKNNTNSLAGLKLNIKEIPKDYFKSRKALLFLYGNNVEYSDLKLIIESENSLPKNHIYIGGNNSKVNRLTYKGGGSIQVGTASNLELTNFTRKEIKCKLLPTFIRVENAENLRLENVTDLAEGKNPTVDCLKAKNCQITNVKSASVNSEIVKKRGNKIVTRKVISIQKNK